MALAATQNTVLGGLAATFAAVSASDTFVPDDRTFLYIKNAGASPDNVVVVTPGTAAGGRAVADETATVTNATERVIGPFPAQDFADPVTGLATVTNSFTTSVTFAVIRLR
jgi:hypothetical protein